MHIGGDIIESVVPSGRAPRPNRRRPQRGVGPWLLVQNVQGAKHRDHLAPGWLLIALLSVIGLSALLHHQRSRVPAISLPRQRTPDLPPPAPPATRARREVAVLIATRNGADTLASTIASAAGQADVYVVSDGSTDDTARIAEESGAKVLALSVNIGKPAALYRANRHFGLTTDYRAVAVLDDDTVIGPDFIRHCLAGLTDRVAIVVGRTITNWTREHRWNPWLAVRAYSYWKYQLLVRRGQSALNVMNCVSGSNSLYRSTVLEQVLIEDTPYIVDDTYWTLETHRRGLGRIAYAPKATALICDPLTGRDWYKQNLRWLWGTLQGIRGHRIGTKRTMFDFMYILMMLDWVLYVVVWPVWIAAVFWIGRDHWPQLLAIYLAGYFIWTTIAAIALRRWRLILLTPFVLVFDWLYRVNFAHALVKALRQPRVTSCRWESPSRYAQGAAA